jgi:PLP dependent protein
MNENALQRIVQERLQAVEERLQAACRRSGRSRQDVTLVAVTKTISAELAAMLPQWGMVELGENRPQELARKVNLNSCEFSNQDVHWHMIGHLQRNKIELVLPLVHLIHSVDSLRLLNALDREADRLGLSPEVLLQFNTSGETSKQGFDPSHIVEEASAILALKCVKVCGLMTMAAYQEPESCRPCFVRLRCLRDDLQAILGPGHPLKSLSMGMTNDFDVAVEEGATLVRLGTILFDGLQNEPT